MPDLHDAFRSLAERHPATGDAAEAVAQRAAVRRRRRSLVRLVSVVVVLVAMAAGTALAARRDGSREVEVAGTVPATDLPIPAPATTFAADDLRSVLPTPDHPVHARAVGTVVVTATGGAPPVVTLCLGPRYLGAPPSCPAPRVEGVEPDAVESLADHRLMVVAGGTVGWAPALVEGWFDGTTIVVDRPIAPAPSPPVSPVSFTSPGPGGPATAEQARAVIDDLTSSGGADLGGLAGHSGPSGVTVMLAWADQALVDRLAARHPGVTITVQPDLAPT